MPNRRGRKATKVSVSASDTGNGMGREIGLVMVAPRRPSLWLCDRSPRPCWPIVAICGQDDAAHSPETKKPLKIKGLNVFGAAGGDRTHDRRCRAHHSIKKHSVAGACSNGNRIS